MKKKINENEDMKFKLILIGDINVGKTALLWKYTEDEFLANKQTFVTIVDFKRKAISIKGK
jgi:GTPase SAR1 family protein